MKLPPAYYDAPLADAALDGEPLSSEEGAAASTPRVAPFGQRGRSTGQVRLAAGEPGKGCSAAGSVPKASSRFPAFSVSPVSPGSMPPPEAAWEAAADSAMVNGVWMSDSSRHGIDRKVNEGDDEGLQASATPREGRPTLRMAYLFSGPQRKSSIAQHLKTMCKRSGFGLDCDEIDILIKGKEHDLFDKDAQEQIMSRIAAGDYDIIILSPPCATWSRARWSNGDGPGPFRNKRYPWGIPHLEYEWQKRHARNGNEFVHFAIRTIVTCQACKRRGLRVMTILEHPEDLGYVRRGLHKGVPASIWQLPELRKAFGEFPFMTVAGHQCKFGVDYPKPTRLLSDILSLVAFGFPGWACFDHEDNYVGPLPRHCGHNHKQQTIGKLPGGGHATSPFASYPDKMCFFLALHIYEDWVKNGRGKLSSPVGRGGSSRRSRTQQSTGTTGSSSSYGIRESRGWRGVAVSSSRTTNSLNGKNGSVPEKPGTSDEGASDISIYHLKCGAEVVGADEMEKARASMWTTMTCPT